VLTLAVIATGVLVLAAPAAATPVPPRGSSAAHEHTQLAWGGGNLTRKAKKVARLATSNPT